MYDLRSLKPHEIFEIQPEVMACQLLRAIPHFNYSCSKFYNHSAYVAAYKAMEAICLSDYYILQMS